MSGFTVTPVPYDLRVDDYVTDGHRLFLVLDVYEGRRSGPTALLEDCRSLRTDVYSASDLAALRLRRVRRAGDD